MQHYLLLYDYVENAVERRAQAARRIRGRARLWARQPLPKPAGS